MVLIKFMSFYRQVQCSDIFMFILQFTCLCLWREGKNVGTHHWRKEGKKRGGKQKENIELVSMSRERDVTANNLMWLSSAETVEQFSVQQQSCSEPGFQVGTASINFSKIASLSGMSRIWALENCREYYCRVLRYFPLFKLAQQALQKSLWVWTKNYLQFPRGQQLFLL